MTSKVLDITTFIQPEGIARAITDVWIRLKQSRDKAERTWKETRDYVFATDTSTTSNSKLPWKNKTTRPKLCQIRDNLFANYMAALFPTTKWFKYEATEDESKNKEKRIAIEAYMASKFKESKFRDVVARLVLDWIDFGNAIGDIEYTNEQYEVPNFGKVQGYVGPRAVRVSPLDIVFDLGAPSFRQTPKITRSLISLGQIEKLIRTNPAWQALPSDVLAKAKDNRTRVTSDTKVEIQKSQGLVADGFSDLATYYSSGMVEFLEFEGDLYDYTTGTLYENHVITIIDRAYVLRKEPIANWLGRSYKEHVGWRLRPDNLMGMGPLDNLVGLQYRIDHLENLKADVFDLIAHPFTKIKGYVEDFEYGPNERAYMEQDADIEHLRPDSTALNADFQIQVLMNEMEEMAGAPRQAMGIRTPGEKTAFEVQTLDIGSSRGFQTKTEYFEENFLEPLMNNMLECARRNLQGEEVVRVIDNDIGVEQFLTITPDDLKGKGKLVAMGARHFAAQAQLIQNLSNLSATGIYQDEAVKVHFSGLKIAQLIEENLGLTEYRIVSPNIRIDETLETQKLLSEAQENAAESSLISTDPQEPEVNGTESEPTVPPTSTG